MTDREQPRETGWARRAVLAAILGALAGLVLLFLGGRRDDERAPADPIVGILRQRDAAVRVGERVLAQYPAWNDAAPLRVALDETLDGDGNLRRQLARSIRRDFETGRVVPVDGWLLGATEARLYALAALTR